MCCGANSLIGQPSIHTVGCRTVRITAKENLLTNDGFTKAYNSISGPTDLLWASIPCVGGSQLQYPNYADGTVATRNKILAHRALFRKLFKEFMKLAQRARSVGAAIAIEWPEKCLYWDEPMVKKFVKNMGLRSVTFHGCMEKKMVGR